MIHNLQKSASETHFDKNISGLNADNVQGAIDELKGTIGYSKKNLLNNTATTQTVKGVTFTVNADKTVTVNGANNDNLYSNIIVGSTILSKGKYILNGTPNNEFSVSGLCMLYFQIGNTTYTDNGQGVEFEVTEDTTVHTKLIVHKGITVNNLVFKPMIRLASIKDDT